MLYPIDAAAHLANVSRHLILVYYKHGLVTAHRDAGDGGWYFDAPTIRMLQRIAYLNQGCGINLTGVRIILELMNEVARLRPAR